MKKIVNKTGADISTHIPAILRDKVLPEALENEGLCISIVYEDDGGETICIEKAKYNHAMVFATM